MAHYKSNWSDPSHYCHQHCLVPLSLLTLFSRSKHFTSIADIISAHSRGGIQQHDICYKTLWDKRRWAGSDQWHYIRRQLWSVSHETTCYNKTPQTQQYFRARKTKLSSVGERERSIRLFLIEVGGVGSNQPRQGGCCVTTNFPPILPTTGTHNNL